MKEHALRRTLSEELHARTFHDFDGAGRFIRFVFLVGNDDSKILAYINKFLTASTLPVMSSEDKFCLHDMAGYALRYDILNFYPLVLLKQGCELKMVWRRMRLMRLNSPICLFFGRAMPQRHCFTQFGLRWEENRYAACRKRGC